MVSERLNKEEDEVEDGRDLAFPVNSMLFSNSAINPNQETKQKQRIQQPPAENSFFSFGLASQKSRANPELKNKLKSFAAPNKTKNKKQDR